MGRVSFLCLSLGVLGVCTVWILLMAKLAWKIQDMDDEHDEDGSKTSA